MLARVLRRWYLLFEVSLEMSLNNLLYILPTVIVVECGIGLVLHALGIFAIVSHPTKTNQTLILFSLSVVEIIFIICKVIDIVSGFSVPISELCGVGASCELLLLMHILTADRLGSVINPFRYKLYLSRSRLKKVIFVSWVFSLIYGVVNGVVVRIELAMNCVLIAIGILYIILVIITYSVIIYKMRRSRIQFNTTTTTNQSQQQQRIMIKKEFLVPTLIIVSFLVFYAFPYLLVVFVYSVDDSLQTRYITIHSLNIFFMFGHIFDPLVYIFLTKNYRDIIVKTCFPCCHSVSAANTNVNIPLERIRTVETRVEGIERRTQEQH